MKILHVMRSANLVDGGPIEAVKQRALALQNLGHQVELVTLDLPHSACVAEFPFPVHAVGTRSGRYGFSTKLYPWLLKNASSYDGVVVNGLWQYQGLAVQRAQRKLRKPYVVFAHGMLDPWFKRSYPLKHIKKSLYWLLFEARVLRSAHSVLFTSEDEMIQARESFWPYCIKEQVVAYGTGGPIGPPESQLQIFLSMYPQLMGKRFLLFLSRIHPKKGCDILLSAFSQAAKNDPNLMLVLAGPDETGWIGELRSHAQALQIEDRLVFTGMLTGDLKWGAFHASEAFILPSHQENFGLVVAEALACSKPVLISNKVNIWREIAHAGAGLVGDDTVEGTAGMIRRWLDLSADEIYAMGSRARDLYQREFNVGASAHSLLGVLNEASAVGRGIPTRAVTETGRAVAAKLK